MYASPHHQVESLPPFYKCNVYWNDIKFTFAIYFKLSFIPYTHSFVCAVIIDKCMFEEILYEVDCDVLT